MDDFREQIRLAVLGWLKERGHKNVPSRGHEKYTIKLRSLQGPPFKFFGKIFIGEAEVECRAEEWLEGGHTDDPKHRSTMFLRYTVDLADPQLFDVIEKFVEEIKN